MWRDLDGREHPGAYQASDEQLVYSTAISSFSTVERSLLRSMTITYV